MHSVTGRSYCKRCAKTSSCAQGLIGFSHKKQMVMFLIYAQNLAAMYSIVADIPQSP